ncbi:predicted protein [Streptomyces sp. SPB78]|uniref:hypothetical protein n=1 Tax=Streptomyces sp. (strain SPB78) TaxID=591157 RepID=UPI0001B56988|nr:hypothetical protein [Streptomyces sp. SPB78]EFL01593.1 predicted protein [Streptomyces sp. SPB78]
MLRTRRARTLALAGGGWSHPYGHGLFSPFLYASGDGGTGDDKGSSGAGGDDKGGTGGKGADGGDGGDDKLGEGGVKALQAERDARRTAEARVRELESQLNGRKDSGAKPDTKPQDDSKAPAVDADALRKELSAELRAEANTRIVRAEVKAAAAQLLADPSDAPRFLDLAKVKVGDDGEPDAKQIKKLLEDLVKERPYLAAKPQPWGDVGGGRQDAPPADVAPGLDRLRHAYASETTTK